MPKLELVESSLIIRLTAAEKLTALHGDIRIPIRKIRGAQTLRPNFWFKLGVRVPGTGLPPFYMAGTYLKPGDRAFVVWNRKNTPLELQLVDHNYTRVVIGVENAEEWAAKITAAAKI